MSLSMPTVVDVMTALGLLDAHGAAPTGAHVQKRCSATGEVLGNVPLLDAAGVEQVVAHSAAAFARLRTMPAPARGEVARALGDAFRAKKDALGALISLETGKILAEGRGEVQEIVDIADYAVGLSRTVGGRTLPSERPAHRLFEQWHPLGPVAVITAFNFPAAVWAWNAFLALVCGDTVVWKPSLKAPLTALAVHRIAMQVLARFELQDAWSLCLCDDTLARVLVRDPRFPLVSATGSTAMGREVAPIVHGRFGRALLELGGNNAVVVLDDADLALATQAIFFGVVGTTGQRCTSTRRILVQRGVRDALVERLTRAFAAVRTGHPLAADTLMGPLVDDAAALAYDHALTRMRAQGAEMLCGAARPTGAPTAAFVLPTLVASTAAMPVVSEEVFAPIAHVIAIDSLEEAIALNNAVPQGLSSSLFTRSLGASEAWLAAAGSDCGIANVNLGTSGAEIGGAFGGEKETGGGREAGSDAWKQYMRRQTCTINGGSTLPLAQGIVFGGPQGGAA